MFSGFQSNAFQSNGFQILTSGSAPVSVSMGGGDYRNYRRHLEKMLKAAEAHDSKRYVKASNDFVESAKVVESTIPQEIVVNSTDIIKPLDLNYDLAINEINRLILLID